MTDFKLGQDQESVRALRPSNFAVPVTLTLTSIPESPSEYDSEGVNAATQAGWFGFVSSSIWPTIISLRHERARSRTVSHGQETLSRNDGLGAAPHANVTLTSFVGSKDLGYVQLPDDSLPSYHASARPFTSPPPYSSMSKSISSSDYNDQAPALPIGSPLGFVANLIVSATFQFVGFALTFLFRTTRAAGYGSCAGLGITLIQFAIFSRMESAARLAHGRHHGSAGPKHGSINGTSPAHAGGIGIQYRLSQLAVTGPLATADWISVASMALGLLLFFTSLFRYWRALRQERLNRPRSSASMMEAQTEALTHRVELHSVSPDNHRVGGEGNTHAPAATLGRPEQQHTVLIAIDEIC